MQCLIFRYRERLPILHGQENIRFLPPIPSDSTLSENTVILVFCLANVHLFPSLCFKESDSYPIPALHIYLCPLIF